MGEGEGGMFQENSIETCILSRVKQITSPGWMHETSARTWCTGKTQRDRAERDGFDDTDTVDVVLDIVGQMADITIVLPYVLCHILSV